MGGFPSLDQLLISSFFIVFTGIISLFPVRSKIISPIASSNSSIHNTVNTKSKDQPTPSNIKITQSISIIKQEVKGGSVQGLHVSPDAIRSQDSNTSRSDTTQQNSQNSSSQNTTTTVSNTSVSTPEPAPAHTITAKTTISTRGKTIQLTIAFPSNGGVITGTMSGDCKGTISGKYDGPPTGNLSGSARATCPAGFLNIPVSISYNGKMAPGDSQAAIHYMVSAFGQNESGSATLGL